MANQTRNDRDSILKNSNIGADELELLRAAIANGELDPDLVDMNDYSDKDTQFYGVEIRNIREAAILALAICKCPEVEHAEITVFNANPQMYDEESVVPRDYILRDEKKVLELLTKEGHEQEFVKEYKHMLYNNIASGIHVLGDVFGGKPYRMTYGYMKHEDGATAQISFAGNPAESRVQDLLDVVFAEFEMLRDYLKSVGKE